MKRASFADGSVPAATRTSGPAGRSTANVSSPIENVSSIGSGVLLIATTTAAGAIETPVIFSNVAVASNWPARPNSVINKPPRRQSAERRRAAGVERVVPRRIGIIGGSEQGPTRTGSNGDRGSVPLGIEVPMFASGGGGGKSPAFPAVIASPRSDVSRTGRSDGAPGAIPVQQTQSNRGSRMGPPRRTTPRSDRLSLRRRETPEPSEVKESRPGAEGNSLAGDVIGDIDRASTASPVQ